MVVVNLQSTQGGCFILLTGKKLLKTGYLALAGLLLAGLVAACGEEPRPSPSPLAVQVAQSPQAPQPPGTVVNAATIRALATVTAASVPTATPLPATTASAALPTATTQLVATATAQPPTATQAAPTATVKPTVTIQPAQKMQIKQSVLLEPMKWEAQTWNNCGPNSAMMALSYYGINLTQEQCRQTLRPNGADKSVTSLELIKFIQSKGLKAIVRENGTFDILRAFISNNIPVITQQWLHEGDDIAHWRVLRGYNLATNTFIFNDSMSEGPNTPVSLSEQAKIWRAFDWRYIPVYSAKQEALVKEILGNEYDEKTNMQLALEEATANAEAKPNDIDMWRNLGYLRYASGDCEGALKVWEQKLTKMLKPTEHGPYNRFLWYQLWPVECYNKLGNNQQVLKIAPAVLETATVYAQMRYYYAVALLNTGRRDDAIAQLKKAVLDDQNFQPSYDMLEKLGV